MSNHKENSQDDINLIRAVCGCFEESFADGGVSLHKVFCACGCTHYKQKLVWTPQELKELKQCKSVDMRKRPIRTYTYNGITRVIGCNCIFVNDEIISVIMWVIKNYDPFLKFMVEVGKKGILR